MFEHFPTNFALKIAHRVNLIQAPSMEDLKAAEKDKLMNPTKSTEVELKKMYVELNCLQEFQELSVANKFEDALIAYHDVAITDEQKTALLLIHKTTPSYIIGHLTNNLLSRVKDSKDRELIEITSALTLILKDDELTDKDKEKIKSQVKRFVVQPIKKSGKG